MEYYLVDIITEELIKESPTDKIPTKLHHRTYLKLVKAHRKEDAERKVKEYAKKSKEIEGTVKKVIVYETIE